MKYFYIILIILAALGNCDAEDFKNYTKNDAIDAVPTKEILLCSSDFKKYKDMIESFAINFGLTPPVVYDANNTINKKLDRKTLSFIGDPTNPSSKECLAKNPSINTEVLKRISSFSEQKFIIPGTKSIDRNNPLSPGNVFCTMSHNHNDVNGYYYIAVSVGDLDCSDDMIANLFSFTRNR